MRHIRPQFKLWLEVETGEPRHQPANRSQENFCNIHVTFEDGRVYALNVWTFDFLPLARFPWPYECTSDDKPASYVIPPDLFVTSLSREVITDAITQLIANGEMKDEWLVDSEEQLSL